MCLFWEARIQLTLKGQRVSVIDFFSARSGIKHDVRLRLQTPKETKVRKRLMMS